MSQITTEIDLGTARRVQASVVALMVCVSVMTFMDRIFLSIAGPNIIKEFGLSETQMGSVFSAFNFSYALLMVPGGHLADRFGPRRVLTAMALGTALLTGLTALSGRPGLGTYIGVFPALLVLRLVLGVCSAPIYPTSGAMCGNWVRVERRAFTYGLVSAGAGLGGAIAPLLFTWMIARSGWRLASWQAAGATTVLAFIWFWYVRDHPAEHPWVGAEGSRLLLGEQNPLPHDRLRLTPWRKLLTDRNLVLLSFAYLTTGYFQYIFYYWIYYYFGSIRHIGATRTALATTATFVAAVVMTPVGGWIADRLGERYGRKMGRRVVAMASLLAAPLLLWLGTKANNFNLLAIMVALALGFASASDGPFWASAIDIGSHEVGAACGALNGVGNVGGFLGPVLTPLIASFAGWSWGLYFGCLLSVVGALVWLMVDPTRAFDTSVPVTVSLQTQPFGQ